MRLQLLFLGAIAALTLGAVSLTGTAPEASISNLPDRAAVTPPETSAPQAITVVAPVTAVVTAQTSTSTRTITAQPGGGFSAQRAVSSAPAACTAAIQAAPMAQGERGIAATSTVASAIPDCIGQLPVEHPGGSPGG